MQSINRFSVFTAVILLILFFTACKEEDLKPSAKVLEINEFIWKSMNDVYLWDDHIPQNIDVNSEFDPEAYFTKLLFKPTDKWSYITDDYDGLINSFKGIEKSFGHEFKLFRASGSNSVYAIVKYTVPNSPAELAGIKRGDVFYQVNGVNLDLDNYYDLLFEKDSYTLSFGEFNQNGQLMFKGEKTLNAVELTENPIHINKTLDIDGIRIGYLVYNRFITDFNDQLISAFNQFKSDQIQDLILDFRYNPGGARYSAVLLSSMLAPALAVENKEIYSRTMWNADVQQYWIDKEGEESPNLLTKFITPEVNLNLERVYILTTSNTASASELVINCLNPYMEVILVGEDHTSGKYVGSITVHDEETSHGWALQPIVMKAANVNGESDYGDGFAPHHIVGDDYDAELGSLAENMLARTAELITGKTITDPARMAASKIPKNLISMPNPRMEERQRLHFEISR
ncbi:MAG: S41 family peptidase [Cytophagales bacterium]|nr:S41 family peptidase [Cytophagales bacterium]